MDIRGKLYCLDRITDVALLQLYRELETKRICIACPEGIGGGYLKGVIFETDHWRVVHNVPGYGGTRVHWTAWKKTHFLNLDEKDAQHELFLIEDRFIHDNNAAAVITTRRRGEMSATCASCGHVHQHFAVAHEGRLGHRTFQIDLGYWPH